MKNKPPDKLSQLHNSFVGLAVLTGIAGGFGGLLVLGQQQISVLVIVGLLILMLLVLLQIGFAIVQVGRTLEQRNPPIAPPVQRESSQESTRRRP